MSELQWLTNHRLRAISRRESDWVFSFSENVALVVECLWRLLEGGRITLTSSDDGHQFGLANPLDVEAEANQRLREARVDSVTLHEGTLDLEIRFDTGHVLQVIATSQGYESWKVQVLGVDYIAVGGGELVIVKR